MQNNKIHLRMMNKDIELRTYYTDDSIQNDLQEYHEIKQDTTLDDIETSFSSKHSPKPLNEYDFFTKQDVETNSKRRKKKKTKKREKSFNLMNIINSELTAAVEITENIVSRVNFSKEHNSHLLNTYTKPKIAKKSNYSYRDAENGYGDRLQAVDLSPIFPRILENAVTEESFIPVEYVAPSMFEDIMAENMNSDTKTSSNFLDISIKNIKFKHHHNFTLQKLLSIKLTDLFDEYIKTQKLIEELSKEIEINRETKNNLKKDLLKVSPNKKDNIRFDDTVRKYMDKLIQSKKQYMKALKDNKDNIHKIISIWSDLEAVREKNGYKETAHTLRIIRTSLDEEIYEKKWVETFDTEFTDKLDTVEFEFVTLYLKYKEAKKDFESGDGEKITRPKLNFDEKAIKDEVEKVVDNIITKEVIKLYLKNDGTVVPDSTIIDKRYIYQNNYHFSVYVDDSFVCESEVYSSDNMFRVDFTEMFSVQILPNNDKITIVLFENGKKLSGNAIHLSDIRKTSSNSSFVSQLFIFDEIIEPNAKYVGCGYSIKEIANINKVRLRSSDLFKEKLYTTSEIYMKVGWNDKIEQNHSEKITYSHELGRTLKRLLNGIEKPSLEVLIDVINKLYEKDISNDNNMIEILGKLSKISILVDDTFEVDEKNPDLLRLKLLHLRNIGGFSTIDNKLVPLHASQISTEQLECLQKMNKQEFNMDYLNNKELEMDPIELQRFIGTKFVQKLNRNMLRNLNEHLLKKTHKDVVREYNISFRTIFSSQSTLGNLASMSDANKKQLLEQSLCKEQDIQVTVLRAFNLPDRTTTIEEVDDDDKIAGFKVRPLRPFVRVQYKGTSAQTVTAIGCHPSWSHTLTIKTKLVIWDMGPTILKVETKLSLAPITATNMKQQQQLIEFSFTCGAKIEPCSSPLTLCTYNQILLNKCLLLSLKPLSTLHVDIFDEHQANITEGYTEEDQSSKTVHYRIYHKWLGTLEIPIYTVLSLGKLRGTFKITTPPLLFGYEPLQSKDSTSLIPEITQLMQKDTTFISLEISTSLSHLGSLQGYNQPLPSFAEDDYLIKHLNNFVTEYTNEFPMRNISLTFIDSTGRNKCVTQFLQPIPLPGKEFWPKDRCESAVSKSSGRSKSSSSSGRRREMEEDRFRDRDSIYSGYESDGVPKMISVCLRYVSLIPSYEATESHVVTLLGLELLKVLHGSPLDHTILLASFFIYLGIKCWVAIGLGLPRGPSSFVLTKYDLTTRRVVLNSDQAFRSRGFLNKTDGYVWYVYDGSNGERYELRDVGCPLKTVDYVFDNENIWVNMQSSQDCESMSFDFTRTSDWKPVFDKTVFVMKQPVVTDQALYSPPPSVDALRGAIEAKIKNKVQKWRPHMKTIWNRYCSTLLQEMLPQWEYWAFNPGSHKPRFTQKLKQLMVTYKIFGFPLNMAYINTKAVVSAVKSTGVHVSDDPNMEFALAVAVYAYPNNVLSLWVFLATISRI